jgi:secreted trypsin-like serine protease
MPRRLSLVLSLSALLGVSACQQVADAPTSPVDALVPSFITNGTVAGARYPAVVLIIMEEKGEPMYTCTGTVIAPKVVLTAGHCTGEPGEFSGMRIFTESDVANGNNNYPYAGPNSIEAKSWKSHPQYSSARFVLHDVGVIELRKAVDIAKAEYGLLPTINALDVLQPRSNTTFTSVGYGVQRINPVKLEFDGRRWFAEPHLLQINSGIAGSFSLLLSNNASTGGTCFGDSGGPNYVGRTRTIAGVTSFGLNGSCGGTGGVFRLDRQDVLDFVNGFVGNVKP